MPATSRSLLPISFTVLAASLLLASSVSAQEAPAAIDVPAARARAIQNNVMLLALDFSRDASTVVTGGDAVRVHDVRTGKLLQEVKVPDLVRGIACSPVTNDRFAAGGDDGVIRLCRVGVERPVREIKAHQQMLINLDFSPDGTQIVSCAVRLTDDRRSIADVRLWDATNGELLHALEFQDTRIFCVRFSHDGQHLALARHMSPGEPMATSVVELYDVREWRLVRSVPFEPGFGIALDFSPDGASLLIAGGICIPTGPGMCQPTGKLWIVDLNDDGPAQPIKVDQSEYFRSASITPAGDLFATGTLGRTPPGMNLVSLIQMRRLDTGEIVWSHEGEVGAPYGVTVSPDGSLVAGCTARLVQILKATTGEPLTTIDVGESP